MILTGKARERFTEWLRNDHDFCKAEDDYIEEWFNTFPQSMQWGVYQDWADSLGYMMFVTFNRHYFIYGMEMYPKHGNRTIIEQEYKSISEARNAAIKKLNEIYNAQ